MKRLLLFLLVLAPLTCLPARLSAQTYQPTWDSVDKRPMPESPTTGLGCWGGSKSRLPQSTNVNM